MRSKKFALVLAAVLVVTISASAFAAKNPFSDVPADHWAYDSVVQLAAVGLVEGYPDGTYGGTRTMTRYEAAMVFARALARLEALVEDQVISNTAGVKEQITGEVLAKLDDIANELTELIIAEFDKPVISAETPVERSYFDMVVGKIDDRLGRLTKNVDQLQAAQADGDEFVMTEEAEAVIAALVGDLAQEYLAEASVMAKETIVEQGVIERIVVEDVDEEVVRAIAEEVLAAQLYSLQTQVDSDRSYLDMVVNKINDRLGRLTRNVDGLKAAYDTDMGVVNGLISALQGDVAGLQEAFNAEIVNVTGTFLNVNNEFAAELALLGVRVEELEMLYAKLDARVSDVETSVAALEEGVGSLEAAVDGLDQKLADQEAAHAALKAETERVTFSGNVKFNGTTRTVFDGDNELDSTTGLFNTKFGSTKLDLGTEVGAKLTARVSEGTVVKLDIAAKAGAPLEIDKPHKYILEVTSDSLIKRFAVGTISGDVGSRFDKHALANKPDKGAVTDLGLGGLNIYALTGLKEGTGLVALGAKYKVFPALGFSLTGVGLPGRGLTSLGQSAVAAGIFGDIAGLNYGVKVALDRYDKDATENLLVDVDLGAALGILNVKANWTMANANFGTGFLTGGTGFFNSAAKTRLRLDADADLFGVGLNAGLYSEKDPDGVKLVDSVMIDANAGFNLLLPIDISGAYGWKMNDVVPEEKDVHTKVKVGVGLELFGVDLGGSFTYVNNYLNGDWRNPGKWLGQDANIIGVNLGYDTSAKGASLDLGYDFELAIPRNETADAFSNKMSHVLSAKYGFSKDMKLNMSLKRVNFEDLVLSKEVTVNEVKAGLEFSF